MRNELDLIKFMKKIHNESFNKRKLERMFYEIVSFIFENVFKT